MDDYRIYLIAHAPVEPQSWFKVKMPTECPALVWIDKRNPIREYYSFDELRKAYPRDNNLDLVKPSNQKEVDVWYNEQQKQICIQWPIAWADAILAAINDECKTSRASIASIPRPPTPPQPTKKYW